MLDKLRHDSLIKMVMFQQIVQPVSSEKFWYKINISERLLYPSRNMCLLGGL